MTLISHRNHRLTAPNIAVKMVIVTTRFPSGDEKGTRYAESKAVAAPATVNSESSPPSTPLAPRWEGEVDDTDL